MKPLRTPNSRASARLERQFASIERLLPVLRRPLHAIRARGWWIVRVPMGLVLILGGLLSILPFLGLWMLPLGFLLLAVDLPLLRGPVSSGIVRLRRRIAVWRHRRR